MNSTSQGQNRQYEFWLFEDQKDWAIVPAGVISGFHEDLPIRLQEGTASWGKRHIESKHGHWLRRLNKSLLQLLHEKLGQPGQIYETEESNKIKIVMRLAPDALLVLRHVENFRYGSFLTVTTMYQQSGAIDGQNIGRYLSEFRALNSQKVRTGMVMK